MPSLDEILELTMLPNFSEKHPDYRDIIYELHQLGILERTNIPRFLPTWGNGFAKADLTVPQYDIVKFEALIDSESVRYLGRKCLKAEIFLYAIGSGFVLRLESLSNNITIYSEGRVEF